MFVNELSAEEKTRIKQFALWDAVALIVACTVFVAL